MILKEAQQASTTFLFNKLYRDQLKNLFFFFFNKSMKKTLSQFNDYFSYLHFLTLCS